jgi:Fanconi-associated nuclease 1
MLNKQIKKKGGANTQLSKISICKIRAKMLTGRESLIRMVGKRRRIESHDAILSRNLTRNNEQNKAKSAACHAPSGQMETDLNTQTVASLQHDLPDMMLASFSAGNLSENIVVDGNVKELEWKIEATDWVSCPVCGKSIEGMDTIINEHLDICLTRRSKRKLTQRTLLQFGVGLSTKNKDKGDSVTLSRKDIIQQDMNQKLLADTVATILPSPPSNNGMSSISTMTDILNGNSRNTGSEVQIQQRSGTLKMLPRAILEMASAERCDVEESISKKHTKMLPSPSKGDIQYKGILSNNETEVNNLADSREGKIAGENDKTLYAHRSSHESWAEYCNRGTSVDHSGLDSMITTLNEKEKAWATSNNLTSFSSSSSKKTNIVSSSLVVVQNDASENINLDSIKNNLLLGILDTHIVGRKFNYEVKVEQRASISVVRDSENPKDKHAIKVTYVGSENGPALGHLPRELARYLSPLIDSGFLQIEGIITSVPENDFGLVPIKLFCQKTQINDEENFGKENFIESIWLKAVHAVKLLNSFPLDTPKYQRNFKIVIQTVLEHHSHLFTSEEKTFLESFQSLSADSQKLFIRLYQRKGPWFRMSNLSYTDIVDLKSAGQELLVAGYISSSESETGSSGAVTKEMLEVLLVPELRQLVSVAVFKEKREVGLAKREELLEWLLSAATQKKEKSLFGGSGETRVPSLFTLFTNVAGCCIQISHLAGLLLWRVQRLFFLSGEQDLSTFLLVDMGLKKYPDYSCRRTQCIFSSRADLLLYEEALEIAQIMDMALDANDMSKVAKSIEISSTYLTNLQKNEKLQSDFLEPNSMFLSRFSAAWVYTKILTLGVSVLERERRYEEAIELLKCLLSRSYCPGQRGYWTLRLSIDLEHMGHLEESLLVAEKGIDDAWVRAGDRMALQRRILRLGKPPRRWKKPAFAKAVGRKIKEVYVRGRPLNSATGAKSIFYGYDGQQCSVEQLALQYYSGEEGGCWQGVHSEGGIWMTYFGLLMWGVLFADVPDVFQTSFQTAPLDLRTDSFYLSRESLIEAQLSNIHMGEAENILSATWETHFGTSCQGVNWDRHSLIELQTIASCIGGPALAAICRLLAEDYGSWAAGMPDLLLWRTSSDEKDLPYRKCGHSLSHGGNSETCSCCFQDAVNNIGTTGSQGEAKLVEVKGPRDRLSEQQRAWILVLMDAGMCVEVCKINEQPKEGE